MKLRFRQLLTVLILSLVLLGGCSPREQERVTEPLTESEEAESTTVPEAEVEGEGETEEQAEAIDRGTTADEDEAAFEIEEADLPDVEESDAIIDPISQADEAAYFGAVELIDASFCDKINNPELAEECRTAVSDEKLVVAALDSLDPNLCDGLSSEDASAACRIRVEVAAQQAFSSAPPTQSEQDIFLQAQNSGDASLCEQIENRDYRKSCIDVANGS